MVKLMTLNKRFLGGNPSDFYINVLFNCHCLNFEGKLRLSCEYKGVLPKVVLQVRQVFSKIKVSIQGGIMLFTSSYFEFARLQNFLKEALSRKMLPYVCWESIQSKVMSLE